jgi:hypothetical protein
MKKILLNMMLLVYQITSYGQSGIVAELATTLKVNGDYDGDGKKEDAWVSYKMVGNNSYCYVNFSNPNIKLLKFVACYAAILTNEGDLNGNKTEEISIVPGYMTSNWQNIQIYGIKSGKWQRMAHESFHLNLADEGMASVIQKSSKNGFISIKSINVDDNAEWSEITKTVKLR